MIILVVGGSKSGNSMLGQRLAKKLESKDSNLYYIATMKPYDKEDIKRINNHLIERDGWGFKTIEQGRNIEEVAAKVKKGDTLLLDSVTSIVTNEMFIEEQFIMNVSEKIFDGIKKLSSKDINLVIVTDYLFSDSILYDDYTEAFRREIGKININLAKISDIVIECCFNNNIIHKGKRYVGDLI